MSPYKLTNPEIDPSKKEVVVIIGGGSASLPNIESTDPNTQYLCIDPVYGDKSDDPLTRNCARSIADKVIALELFSCSGTKTTLPPESVNRVVLTDVLNSLERDIQKNDCPLAEELLMEAKRILKKDGVINIGTDNYSHLTAEEIIALGNKIGLKCRVLFQFPRPTASEAKLFNRLMYKNIDSDGLLEKYLIEMVKPDTDAKS